MIKLFFFTVLILIRTLAHADCVGVYSANSWEFLDSHSIILYDFSKPLAILRIPWCDVFDLSDICLTENYICEGDKLIVDNKTCEIREVQLPIIEDGNIKVSPFSTMPLLLKGSPEFSVDEFTTGLTVKALCKEVNKDNYGIEFKTINNTIERLNEILQIPNFYDICIKKKKSIKLNKYAQKLISVSKSYRHKNFSELSKDQQKNVSKLNRIILKTLYPKTCPKIQLMKLICPDD
jgi:hypothetical protein